MRQAIEEATEDSTRTASFVIWRTEQILKDGIDAGGEAVAPSQRTLYRLFDKLARGQAHHRVGAHPPVAGRPPGRAVRAR